MTSEPTQTMSAGVLRQLDSITKGYTGFCPRPLSSVCMLVAGPKACGKSYLVESIPGAIRFDLDRRSSNPYNRAARNYPAIGEAIDYAALMKMVNAICDNAIKGVRPPCVVFDSINGIWDLAKDHFAKEKKEDFDRLVDPSRGTITRSVWAAVNARAALPILRLRNAGVGVVGVTNIQIDFIEVNHEKLRKSSFNLTNGFWNGIENAVEMIVGVDAQTIPLKRQKLDATGKPVLVLGKPLMEPTGEYDEKHHVIFHAHDSHLSSLIALRLPFVDRIEIPAINSWDAFSAEYDRARTAAINASKSLTTTGEPA